MEKVNIQGVPEAILQTLFARAAYSQQKNAKFQDSKAFLPFALRWRIGRVETDKVNISFDLLLTIVFVVVFILFTNCVKLFCRKYMKRSKEHDDQ